MFRTSIFFLLTLVSIEFSIAQPSNNICNSAIHIQSIDDYCSGLAQFNNINATGTPGLMNTCLSNFESEVWFSFIPQTPAAIIQVFGAINNQGTLISPVVTVYSDCSAGDQIGCNSASQEANIAEVVIADLIIGQTYYLTVDGQFGGQGSFTLCIDGFIPPPSPESDCNRSVVLCDKSPFFIESLIGSGSNTNEVVGTCIQEEFASSWYKWTCETSGTLSFTLTPNDFVQGFESDDLDFAVYELPGGIDDCANKQLLRCMASGANQQQPFSAWEICNGPTGLSLSSTDDTEAPGCQPGNDNFVAPLNMIAGRSYALIVNNFSQSGLGFSIEFGGTGTFLGPSPSFEIDAVQAFECDKTLVFTNLSLSNTDSIVSYIWNFGAGATPITANSFGPHNVIYESFGDKKVALTVESSRGCIVTEILDIYVEPCCADTSTLAVSANARDQLCPGTASGQIEAMGTAGSPEYQFSLDGINFQPGATFPGLLPGDYMLFIQDEKGCTNETTVSILESEIFGIDAGDTLFATLGENVTINTTLIPNVLPGSVVWSPFDPMIFPENFGTLSLNEQLNPTILPCNAFSTFTVTIMNDIGCVASDEVTIVLDIIRPLFIPNVITPNNDNVNDVALVFGGTAVQSVKLFAIYNRWGGLVYEAKDFPVSDGFINTEFGWNGTEGNDGSTYVEPGVYSYVAEVAFLDKVVVPYHGTITVLR